MGRWGVMRMAGLGVVIHRRWCSMGSLWAPALMRCSAQSAKPSVVMAARSAWASISCTLLCWLHGVGEIECSTNAGWPYCVAGATVDPLHTQLMSPVPRVLKIILVPKGLRRGRRGRRPDTIREAGRRRGPRLGLPLPQHIPVSHGLRRGRRPGTTRGELSWRRGPRSLRGSCASRSA